MNGQTNKQTYKQADCRQASTFGSMPRSGIRPSLPGGHGFTEGITEGLVK